MTVVVEVLVEVVVEEELRKDPGTPQSGSQVYHHYAPGGYAHHPENHKFKLHARLTYGHKICMD